MGRPSKWEEVKEKLTLVEGWARDGLTDKQIAHNLGITESTLYVYKSKYQELTEALKKGKEVIDYMVENALLKKALGYTFDEVTRERVQRKGIGGEALYNAEGMPLYEMAVTKIVKKEVAPDTTAQIFWLKNRKPTEWRDKRDIEHSGNLNTEINISIDGEDYAD